MKKSIFAGICVSLVLSTALFAQEIPKTDTKAIQTLNEAKGEFTKKDYFRSYQLFQSLQQKYPDDPELNFYIGRCAFELKDYEAASAAYDRILIKEPMNARVKLELARTYYEIDQLDESEKLFKEVRMDPRTPPKVQDTIKKFLIAIDQKRQKSFTNAFLMIGYNYDSNVNTGLSGDDVGTAYTSSIIPTPPQNAAAKEDYYMSTILGVTNMLDVGGRGGWFIKSSLIGYMQNYREETQYNMGLLMGSVGPAYLGKNYEISMPIHYNRVWKVDAQNTAQKLSMPYKLAMFQVGPEYMKDYGISLKFNQFLSDTFSYYAGLTFKWKLYDPQDFTQGGDSNKKNNAFSKIFTFGLTQQIIKDLFFSPSIAISGDEPTSNGYDPVTNGYGDVKLGRNISNGQALNLELKYALNSKWQVSGNAYMKESQYKDKYANFATATGIAYDYRNDSERDFGLGTQYTINKNSNVKLDYKHIDNYSSIKQYTYHKDTVSINYFYLF